MGTHLKWKSMTPHTVSQCIDSRLELWNESYEMGFLRLCEFSTFYTVWYHELGYRKWMEALKFSYVFKAILTLSLGRGKVLTWLIFYMFGNFYPTAIDNTVINAPFIYFPII